MSEVDKGVDKLLQEFIELDKKRKESVFGTRNGEEALMRLCEYMKGNAKGLTDAARQRTLEKLRVMNLLPYRTYCREHLLDIGITNV